MSRAPRRVDRALRRLMRCDACSVCGGKLKHNSRTAGGPHFSWPCSAQSGSKPTYEQITDEQIAEAVLDHIARRGGDLRITPNLRDPPWTSDDRDWFERNQNRSHRLRLPFPGEYDEEVAKAPTGHALIVLVRQVEPGMRIRPAVSLNADLLPLPDDEAVAHALFEVAMQREAMPSDRQALHALIEKYRTQEAGQ